MKFKSFIIVALAIGLMLTLPVQAQQTFSARASKTYYKALVKVDGFTSAAGTTTGALAAKTDTSEVITSLGGAERISFTITANDTALLEHYYIDYQVVGLNTAWTNALDDSLINNGATSNTGGSKEFIFRNTTTEKYGGIAYKIRTRKQFRVGNGTSTPTYTETVNWKP